MRRNAAAAGISPKTFDKLAQTGGYSTARNITQTARVGRYRDSRTGEIRHKQSSIQAARYNAAVTLNLIPSSVSIADFYDADFDYDFPDDFDWWYS